MCRFLVRSKRIFKMEMKRLKKNKQSRIPSDVIRFMAWTKLISVSANRKERTTFVFVIVVCLFRTSCDCDNEKRCHWKFELLSEHRYASFWLPTNTQPSFSQYEIQQCVILVMRRFSYQQIRHLNVWNALHVTPVPNPSSLSDSVPTHSLQHLKLLNPLKIHLNVYAATSMLRVSTGVSIIYGTNGAHLVS